MYNFVQQYLYYLKFLKKKKKKKKKKNLNYNSTLSFLGLFHYQLISILNFFSINIMISSVFS